MNKFLGVLLLASMSFAGIESLISKSQFDAMFPNRNKSTCATSGAATTYTYEALVEAATWFPDFANVGTTTDKKREIAAFLGQVSHETTGGAGTWCGGVVNQSSDCFNWGLCFTEELGCSSGVCTGYTAANATYPAVAGQTYHGRGAIQLSWNYNYGQASEELTNNKNTLLANPGLVKTSTWAFRTALWFWMDATSSRPSPHKIITGQATGDSRGGTFGGVTNAINGGIECGSSANLSKQQDRVNFFKNFAADLGISAKPSTFTGSDDAYFYCTSQSNFAAIPWTGQDTPTNINQGGGGTLSSIAVSSSSVTSSIAQSSSSWTASSSSQITISSSSQVVVSSSQGTGNTDCDDWVEGVCAWNGVSYECASDRVTSDGVNAYSCVAGSEVWCNGYGPANNNWDQWAVSGTCHAVTSLAEDVLLQTTSVELQGKALFVDQADYSQVSIQISNMLGERLLSRDVQGSSMIDLQYYQAGNYVLRVVNPVDPAQNRSLKITIR